MSDLPKDPKDIFLAALDRPPAERVRFLSDACAEDSALRRQVEDLLQAHEEPNSLLDCPRIDLGLPCAPALSPTIDTGPANEQLGSTIGRYKLVHEMGQGGMGMVYMAVQKEPVKRKVALKVIKPGMDTREVVARFEAERQALALMDHPSIATVHDGGTTDSGRPYFVMELVVGTPITEYCDECKYSTRQRLELFTQVCQAVQHAHQKGVIHRDIKPSNILVTNDDDKAVPKVIDFGIAKAVHQPLADHSVYTHAAQMIGTPLYMSPEQAQRTGMDVDTRTDVYSLGVLLYELLTGTTPFDKERLQTSGLDEFKRIIREEEPPKPSTRLTTVNAALETVADKHSTDLRTLSQELSGELDWIVMKALEKDRTRRYESANDFAKDIQRHLDDEPVEACPPSTAYRLGKFYRRNKVALLALSAVALALIVGAGVAGWQAVVATTANNFAKEQQVLAERRLVEVDEQRSLAEQNFQIAFDAVDQMLTEVASDQLKDIPQAEPVRRALLEKSLNFFVAFLDERGDDPKVQAKAAKAQKRAGDILKLLGEHKRAAKHYQEAVTILNDLQSQVPDDAQTCHALADAQREFAELLADTGEQDEALALLGQALDTQKRLVAKFPESTEYQDLLGNIYASTGKVQLATGQLKDAAATLDTGFRSGRTASLQVETGKLRHQTGKLDQAIASYRSALQSWNRLLKESPQDATIRESLAGAHVSLGLAQYRAGRFEDAKTSWDEALAICEQLTRDFPAVPGYQRLLAAALANRGLCSAVRALEDDAEVFYRRSLEIALDLAAEFPMVTQYRMDVVSAYTNVGSALGRTGRTDEAVESFRAALEVARQLVQDHPTRPAYRQVLGRSYHNLAETMRILGKFEEVEPLYRQAVTVRGELVGDAPTVPIYRAELADTQRSLGMHLGRMGRVEEAEHLLRDCLKHMRQLARDFPAMPEYRGRLGDALQALASQLISADQRSDEAREYLLESMSVLESLTRDLPDVPQHSWSLACSYNGLANMLHLTGKSEEALSWIEKALDQGRLGCDKWPERVNFRVMVAVEAENMGALLTQSRPDEAEAYFREAISACQELVRLDPARPDYRGSLVDSQQKLGRLLGENERPQEALEAFAAAIETAAQPTAGMFIDRGDIYLKNLQQYEQAITEYSKAIELDSEEWRAFQGRGDAYKHLSRWENAISDYREANRCNREAWQPSHGIFMAFRQRGDWNGAVATFTELIDQDSEHGRLYKHRADAYRKLGQLEKALEDYDTAIRVGSWDKRQDLQKRADTHRRLGRYEMALADYQAAIDMDPEKDGNGFKRTTGYIRRGDIFLTSLQQPDKAVAEYTKAAELDPEDHGVYESRGNAYLELSQWDEAIADFREALRRAPRDTKGVDGILAAYRAQGDLDGAVATFSGLIENDPSDWRCYIGRARSRQERGDQELAMQDLREAVRINTEQNSGDHKTRAGLYRELGEHEKAINEYTSLLQRDDLNANIALETHVRLACAYWMLNRHEEADAACGAAAALDVQPRSAALALLRAGLSLLTDKTDEYRQTCGQAFGEFGSSNKVLPDLVAVRCCILGPQAVDDPLRPVRLAEHTVGQVGSTLRPFALHVLGMAHLRAAQYDRAAERLHDSLDGDSESKMRCVNLLGLALVHHQRGESSEAEQWLAKAVDYIEAHPEEFTFDPCNWLEGRLLLREAERLLGTPGYSKDTVDPEQEEQTSGSG
jgi:tetratricopeptide (TPR) repeat protein/tRNA A-37 threonylcarbamoyl transferase component Bud32